MQRNRFEIVEGEGVARGIYIIVDTETNVQYLVTKFGAAGGMCPLINSDGSPLLKKG